MGSDDLPVEVLGERALRHAGSIRAPSRRFNGIALIALGACLFPGAAAALEVPGSDGRLAVSGYLDGRAVADTGGGPRERPQALLDLRLDGTLTRALHTHLELRTRAGGPFEGGHPGLYNFNHTFQNRSPAVEVDESYADLHLHSADVRIGIQKVAWGKLDGVPPTDVVNPRDFHDPLVDDVEERKIGIPALLGTYYLPDVPRLGLTGLRTTLVYVPLAVPPRLALAEERWFPRSTVPPARFVVPPAVASRALGMPVATPLVIPVKFGTLNAHPPHQLDAGGVGLRLGGSWRESDWDVYHYTGPETGPDADLRPELILRSAAPLRLRATSVLRQAHDTIHMTGADWAMPIGGVTVRAEVANFLDRPYLRLASDLISPAALDALPLHRVVQQLLRQGHAAVPLGDLFVNRDSVEWGVGADSLFHGFQPLVQVNQIALLESAPRLLIHDPETRVTTLLRRLLLRDRLELEVRATYAVERGAWFALPRASYLVNDDLRLRLGYLAIGGTHRSIIGQFHDNGEVVLQARYSF